MDSKEIEHTSTSDFMTENPDTCINATNSNRVKKYHWKGMNEEQKKDIISTMRDQVEDKKKKVEMEKEGARLWAEQEENKRLTLVKQTLEKQKKEKETLGALKDTHMAQTAEKKAKWGNYYGEKLPFDKPAA